MKIDRILDLDDPRLDPYRNLKTNNPSRWSDGFIAEGKWVVERLLDSSLEIFSLLVSEKRIDQFSLKITREIPVWVVPHQLASQLVGFDFHAGILGHGKRPNPDKTLTDLIELCNSQPRVTLVACPNTTLPDNLGSIIRLSTAFGVTGLIVTPQSADPFSRRTVRVSMGNIFRLPAVEISDLSSQFAIFKQLGFQLIACHQGPHSVDVRRYDWPDKTVVIFGNEAYGIPSNLADLCDFHLEIPITAKVDSLNVSTAAAIILYERNRKLDLDLEKR